MLHKGLPYRTVSADFLPHLHRLKTSGLLERLFRQKELIPHQTLKKPFPFPTDAAALLKPTPLPFVSHPYEWCFSQWKQAAALTLRLAMQAVDHGMTLKDASAYNVQFHEGRALWIDTLSFESGDTPGPWIAYRQFCCHFLATLAGMSRIHPRWGLYFRSRMNGFDLQEVSRALPASTWFNPFLASHLHLQSHFENRPLKPGQTQKPLPMNGAMLRGLLDNLSKGIDRMRPPKAKNSWIRYAEELPYPPVAAERKKRIVSSWIRRISPDTLWDLGANTGAFSLAAASQVPFILALDSDHGSIEHLWEEVRSRGIKNLLPLWMDLADPSPSQGWMGLERASLFDRGPADLVLALALVHHLTFSALIPVNRQADFFARCGKHLILEFPGPKDRQVKALVAKRQNLLTSYNISKLERSYTPSFRILEKIALPSCDRTLYLMEKRRPSR